MTKLTQEYLNSLFEYREGELYRKTKSHTRAVIGERVGVITPQGYVQVGIKYRYHYAHRLIFLMHHGYMPEIVDHIDGNKTNNKIENLREATSRQNNQNQSLHRNNTSGIKGVMWNKSQNRWVARCGFNGKYYHLGNFTDKELAKKAVEKFRAQHHKEYARHT